MKQTKLYHAVLVDLDGTLTDPEEGITRSFRHALRRFGIEETDQNKLRQVIGPPLLESFVRLYGFSQLDALLAVETYREYFSKTGIFENKIYPGIEEMLQALKEGGLKLAVATSKPTVFANRILEHFHIARYFDFVAGSELDGTRTDKAEVIRWALSHIGEPPESAVMVGDRKHDMIGAVKTGTYPLGALYSYGSREELTEAGAKHLAQTPSEIGEYILTDL